MAAGQSGPYGGGFDPLFSIFYDLMNYKVREILLVASPYDAYIMEEDGSTAQKIINEYHGHNLSKPPRITGVSTVEQARGDHPPGVRSSSMLEDAQFRRYACLYSTFTLLNSLPDCEVGFQHLLKTVKQIYASTWFEGPRMFFPFRWQPGRTTLCRPWKPPGTGSSTLRRRSSRRLEIPLKARPALSPAPAT
jgi:hypothetical protein